MSQTVISAPTTLDGVTIAAPVPTLALPAALPIETVTLGRQPNNDGDNSGAMWFE